MSQLAAAPTNHFRKIILLVVVLVLAGVAGGYYYWTKDLVSTNDAYVEGDIHSISPRVAGYVVDVFVTDNQAVKKGQPLFTLDPSEYRVALAQAQASLAEAQATLLSLELGVPLERAQTGFRVLGAESDLASLERSVEKAREDENVAVRDLARAVADQHQAGLDLRRYSALARTAAAAKATLDAAKTRAATAHAALGVAQARVEAAKKQTAAVAQQLERLRANIDLAQTGTDQADIKAHLVDAQKARVELAQARLEDAKLNLSYTTAASPVDGHVTRKSVQKGMMVSRGQPLMAVVPLGPEAIWVTANFKESEITHIAPGQPADIEVDAYPGVKLKGRVDSIMAGSGAAFSLFPPENASGNFVKVVQRIPVKILLDPGDRPVLRIGMSVIPTIRAKR